MSFPEPKLSYKAMEYASNSSKPQWIDRTLNLTKLPSGDGYGAGDNQILVKVAAASLNPVDSTLYNSYYKWFAYFNGTAGIGFDYSGTVVSIGASAAKMTDLEVGTEVSGLYYHPFGRGSVTQYLLLDARNDTVITRKPKSLDMASAATWPLVYGTAHLLMEKTGVKKDDRVLVLGGNTGVGRLAIQLMAKIYKTGSIVAVCSGQSADYVKSLGADSIIDYSQYKSLKEPAQKEAAVLKFDVIMDCVGNHDFFDCMPTVLRKNGSYATVCGENKFVYQTISFTNIIYNTVYNVSRQFLCAIGVNKYYYYNLLLSKGPWIHEGSRRFDEGLVLTSDSTYDVSEFDRAFERLRSNKASGKIVVIILHDS